MRLLHEIAIFQTVKSKVLISLFETVRLSVSISLRNLYNSLNSIKEKFMLSFVEIQPVVAENSREHEVCAIYGDSIHAKRAIAMGETHQITTCR